MTGRIKKAIQKPFLWNRHRLYEKGIAKQKLSYSGWLRTVLEAEETEILAWKKEAESAGKALPEVEVLPWERLGECFLADGAAGRIFLLTPAPERLAEGAVWEVKRFFYEHPEITIAYGDESDYFKPGWSPELLQSFFYFGRVFAVRQELVEKVRAKADLYSFARYSERTGKSAEEKNTLVRKSIYAFALDCIDEAGEAGLIGKILYLPKKIPEKRRERLGKPVLEKAGESGEENVSGKDWGMEAEFAELKKGRLYSDVEISEKQEEQPLVSVIIPSKDNPAVLSHCIHSLREGTNYRNLEILVVDNGSNEKNKNRILQMREQFREEYGFRYLYVPMTFHFSAMCNIGARQAAGSYLLFLNDDMEIAEENWLRTMMKRAAKKGVGAVGAKLLYPDSDQIQHAGITSIHLGPAHKLQFSFDRNVYYHGYNRCAVNVSAVTGACLLIKKEAFEEAGGFQEKLPVAFNDVELCFHLQKLGYRNVCCNDTFLYHHESLSRGEDAGIEKIKRLHAERDFLYGLYPERWNQDAYYSKKLVTDILDRGFEGRYRFEETRVSGRGEPVRMEKPLKVSWYNECLYMGVEFAGDRSAWETGKAGAGDYYIQGWCYAVNVDNSRYRKSLLLKRMTGEIWKMPYEECYRPDMEENLPYIDHPALPGVSVWFDRKALPEGEYLIGYFWEDACSRQKLCGFSAETILIG